MWYYVDGVPDGSAVGKTVKEALRRSGLPALRGLAPGMLEDAKAGLDPKPVVAALLGSGYAQCRKVTLPVGDTFGNISNPKTKEKWILGNVEMKGRIPHQTRWVQDVDAAGNPIYLFVDEWDKAPKTHCPDGKSKAEYGGTCPPNTEGFTLKVASQTRNLEGWIVAATLTTVALITIGKCMASK